VGIFYFKGNIMSEYTQPGFAGSAARRGLSIAVLALSGFAMAMPAMAQTTDHAAGHTATTTNAPMDMHGSMTGMQHDMAAVKASGDTDYDFAVMMRIHHQGAVDMAQMELDKGKDPKLQAMAKEIIEAQKKEITQFDEWIADYEKRKK